MKEPTLIIMAAGMGSRFGGLKQLEPMSSQGEVILDFSLYDAVMAGFNRAVLVIRKENESMFREHLDQGAGKYIDIQYASQELSDLPEGFKVPEGREKPWGTAHAVLAARKLADGPVTVINADDYYGPTAFHTIYDFLEHTCDDQQYHYGMVGYQLEKTLSDNGYVSRGICGITADGMLSSISEGLKIGWKDGEIVSTCDGGISCETLTKGATTVSMNFWGFTPSIMTELEARFPAFMSNALENDPMKAEYMLPSIVDQLIKEGRADVKVLSTPDRWYGVTYREDRESVADSLQSLKDRGEYPEKLWK